MDDGIGGPQAAAYRRSYPFAKIPGGEARRVADNKRIVDPRDLYGMLQRAE